MEKEGNYPPALCEEIRRVIILYAASIIEAVLLFLYKQGNFSYSKEEYKEIRRLPLKYQLEKDFTLVLAKQRKVKRSERELMLDVLVKFFAGEGVINEQLAEKIKNVKNVRNTLHLSKSREGIQCNSDLITDSIDAVVETIISAQTYLLKK